VATLWGSAAGLGLAFLLAARRSRRLVLVLALATLLWVIPTFLVAVVIQEVQAQIYNVTGQPVSGGFGVVNGFQVFWAAVVLGVRPAAYVFRQARVSLDLELMSDHVRTARAKGLEWPSVLARHVVRPAAATLLSAWMSSFRLMIGSLPLVEFFFGYPGLGEMLILALGLTFGIQGRAGQVQEAADPVPAHHLQQRPAIRQVDLLDRQVVAAKLRGQDVGRPPGPISGQQDTAASVQEAAGGVQADEAHPAGDQNFHAFS